MKTLYSIGEFSQITGLSVKTLRFYHEKGLLAPSSVDEGTGYRFYAPGKVEKARVIMRLRQMEFSVEDVAAILESCGDEADVLDYLEKQKQTLRQRVQEDRDIVQALGQIIADATTARRLLQSGDHGVEEKTLEPQWIAGFRMKGAYSDCGRGFSRLGKAVGRHLSGRPFCLYYDGEYRDGDADFEACFPLRREIAAEGLSIRQLPGGRFLTLIHRGPYDQLGRSYAKILPQVRERNLTLTLPTRD
jgi:DNA-binding transcriptional MerR regulator/effector-binding domain-containing protein